MITNQTPIQIAKVFAGEDPNSPVYVALGTGTTAESRVDTALETEVARKLGTGGNDGPIGYIQLELKSTDSEFIGTFYEDGLLDESADGTLYEHSTNEGYSHFDTINTRITKFMAINPNKNTNSLMVSNAGVEAITSWIGGVSPVVPTHFAWGSHLILDTCNATTDWTASTDATAAATETDNIREGTAALKLGKSGTTEAFFYYEKTLSGVIDGSNAEDIQIFVYFATSADFAKLESSDCLNVRVGNDSSNYYHINYDAADLTVGWNRLTIPIANMTEVGTVDLSTLDYLRLTFTLQNITDTITSGNVLMDYWCLTWPLDYDDTAMHDEQYRVALQSGYPSRTNTQVKFKAIALKANGNTFIYNYAALFNAASNGDMYMRTFFYDKIKNSTTQITHEATINTSIGGGS